MCIAHTGKVISTTQKSAIVDFNGVTIEAKTGLLDVKPGDSVLVHAGCVLQKFTEDNALTIEKLMSELDSFLK